MVGEYRLRFWNISSHFMVVMGQLWLVASSLISCCCCVDCPFLPARTLHRDNVAGYRLLDSSDCEVGFVKGGDKHEKKKNSQKVV